jgi:hypothetical protein
MNVGGNKVCVVDFTRPSLEIFTKLRNEWEKQAPNMNSEVRQAYQAVQAAEITDYNIFEEQQNLKKRANELRKKLLAVQGAESKAAENDKANKLREELQAIKDAESKAAKNDKANKLSEELLFELMFHPNKELKPTIVFANTKHNILIRRRYTRLCHDNTNSFEQLKKITESMRDGAELEPIFDEIAKFLGPKVDKTKRKVKLEAECSFSDIFRDYIDIIPDYIEAYGGELKVVQNDNAERIPSRIHGQPIKYTQRFYRQWKNNQEIRDLLSKVLPKLVKKPDFNGLKIKKIKETKNKSFFRMWLDKKHRLHFRGKPSEPILIGIGKHRVDGYG